MHNRIKKITETGVVCKGMSMSLKNVRDIVLTLAVIFVISLMLNYIWESMHEAFLYEVSKCDAEHYILMILEAAVVDASIILGIYLWVTVVWRDIFWLMHMKRNQLYTACAAGIIVAVIIEYRSVLVLKEWSYLPAMPTIFGIGLTPLIQLSTTGLLTFWLAGRVLYKGSRGSCNEQD